jgi:hypothetical protein
MAEVEFSEGLMRWAANANYALTPQDASGAAIFWSDPGGEIRYYIRREGDTGFTITQAQRASREEFRLFATSIGGVERYFYHIFGSDVRDQQRMPRLNTPRRPDEVASGFSIADVDADGNRKLIGLHGAVAIARGRIQSVPILVLLSHLLLAAIDDIKESYGRPDGRPLFPTVLDNN